MPLTAHAIVFELPEDYKDIGSNPSAFSPKKSDIQGALKGAREASLQALVFTELTLTGLDNNNESIITIKDDSSFYEKFFEALVKGAPLYFYLPNIGQTAYTGPAHLAELLNEFRERTEEFTNYSSFFRAPIAEHLITFCRWIDTIFNGDLKLAFDYLIKKTDDQLNEELNFPIPLPDGKKLLDAFKKTTIAAQISTLKKTQADLVAELNKADAIEDPTAFFESFKKKASALLTSINDLNEPTKQKEEALFSKMQKDVKKIVELALIKAQLSSALTINSEIPIKDQLVILQQGIQDFIESYNREKTSLGITFDITPLIQAREKEISDARWKAEMTMHTQTLTQHLALAKRTVLALNETSHAQFLPSIALLEEKLQVFLSDKLADATQNNKRAIQDVLAATAAEITELNTEIGEARKAKYQQDLAEKRHAETEQNRLIEATSDIITKINALSNESLNQNPDKLLELQKAINTLNQQYITTIREHITPAEIQAVQDARMDDACTAANEKITPAATASAQSIIDASARLTLALAPDALNTLTQKAIQTLLDTEISVLESGKAIDPATLAALGVPEEKKAAFSTAITDIDDFLERVRDVLNEKTRQLNEHLDSTIAALEALDNALTQLPGYPKNFPSLSALIKHLDFPEEDALINMSLPELSKIDGKIERASNAVNAAQQKHALLVKESKITAVQSELKKITASGKLSPEESAKLNLAENPVSLAAKILQERALTAKTSALDSARAVLPDLIDDEIPIIVLNAGSAEDGAASQRELVAINDFNENGVASILQERIAAAKESVITSILLNTAISREMVTEHPAFSQNISQEANIDNLKNTLGSYTKTLNGTGGTDIVFYQNIVMQYHLKNLLKDYGFGDNILAIENNFKRLASPQKEQLTALVDNPFQLDTNQIQNQNVTLTSILQHTDAFFAQLLRENIRIANEQIKAFFDSEHFPGGDLQIFEQNIPAAETTLEDLKSQLESRKETISSSSALSAFSATVLKTRIVAAQTEINTALSEANFTITEVDALPLKLQQREQVNALIILPTTEDSQHLSDQLKTLLDMQRAPNTFIASLHEVELHTEIAVKEKEINTLVTTALRAVDPTITAVDATDSATLRANLPSLVLPTPTLNALKEKLAALTLAVTDLEKPERSEAVAATVMEARVSAAQTKAYEKLRSFLKAKNMVLTDTEINRVLDLAKETPYAKTNFPPIRENATPKDIITLAQQHLNNHARLQLDPLSTQKRLANEAIILYAQEKILTQIADLILDISEPEIQTIIDSQGMLLDKNIRVHDARTIDRLADTLIHATNTKEPAKKIAVEILCRQIKTRQAAIIAGTGLTRKKADIYFPKTNRNHSAVTALFTAPAKRLLESQDAAIARLKSDLARLSPSFDEFISREQTNELVTKNEKFTTAIKKVVETQTNLLCMPDVLDKAINETWDHLNTTAKNNAAARLIDRDYQTNPGKLLKAFQTLTSEDIQSTLDAITLRTGIFTLRTHLMPTHTELSFDDDQASNTHHEWMTRNTSALSNNALRTLFNELNAYNRLLNPMTSEQYDSLMNVFSKDDYTKMAAQLSSAARKEVLNLADESTVTLTPTTEKNIVYDEKRNLLTASYNASWTEKNAAGVDEPKSTETELRRETTADNKERKTIWHLVSKEPVSWEIESAMVARDSLTVRLAEKQLLEEKIARLKRNERAMPEGTQKTTLLAQIEGLTEQFNKFDPRALTLSIKNDAGRKEDFTLADGTIIQTTRNVFISMKAHFKAGYTAICIDNVIYNNPASPVVTAQLPSVVTSKHEHPEVQRAVKNGDLFVSIVFDPKNDKTVSFETHLKANVRCLAAGSQFVNPVVVTVPVVMTQSEFDDFCQKSQSENHEDFFNKLATQTNKALKLPSTVSVVPLVMIDGDAAPEFVTLSQQKLLAHIEQGNPVLCCSKPEDRDMTSNDGAYASVLKACEQAARDKNQHKTILIALRT
ncbi:MAG: hypothetical protein Q8L78_07840 [Coxiellaceae bacterium]|nr:hypothetical protein [Coxiellaceae bacterium]